MEQDPGEKVQEQEEEQVGGRAAVQPWVRVAFVFVPAVVKRYNTRWAYLVLKPNALNVAQP